MNTIIQITNNERVRKTIDMLFLTTKKESLEEEEIIKECEKNDLTEEETKQSLKQLCTQKIIKDIGHLVYMKIKPEE